MILSLGYEGRETRRTHFEAFSAEFAIQAAVREPLDTDSVSNLDWRIGSVRANGDNLADTLMSTDERVAWRYRPVTFFRVQVSMTYTCVSDLDETFPGF